jgi:hypothetical protein
MIKVSIDRQVMQSVMSGVADQIKSKIDLNYVKKICKKLYGIETIKDVEHKDANIVVIENQVGCKLDLEVRFSMSIFISTKENSDSSLPVNNNIPKELDIPKGLDDISEEPDIPEEEIDLSGFDDIEGEELDLSGFDEIRKKKLDLSEEFDDIREEELDLSGFEDIQEEVLDLSEFDEIRKKKLDDMGRLKKKPLIVKNNKKRQKVS